VAEEMALRMAGCDTEQVGHVSRREASGPDGASGMSARQLREQLHLTALTDDALEGAAGLFGEEEDEWDEALGAGPANAAAEELRQLVLEHQEVAEVIGPRFFAAPIHQLPEWMVLGRARLLPVTVLAIPRESTSISSAQGSAGSGVCAWTVSEWAGAT
jgi:hypothetical protein